MLAGHSGPLHDTEYVAIAKSASIKTYTLKLISSLPRLQKPKYKYNTPKQCASQTDMLGTCSPANMLL